MDGAMDDEAILPSWSRTYADYRSRFVDAFKLPLSPNKTIVLEQRPNVSAEHAKESKHSADGSCTASTVWDAGIVLATHVFASVPAIDPAAMCWSTFVWPLRLAVLLSAVCDDASWVCPCPDVVAFGDS